MTLLTLKNLSVRRGQCPVVDNVSLEIRSHELVGLVGPNGAGKTTLLKAALGLIEHSGDSSLAALPLNERSSTAAWMPQEREINWPISVLETVALGQLLPNKNLDKNEIINDALDRTGLINYRDRISTELSGGEQARVLLARALAQNTPLILADEPIAGLDPATQLTTMKMFADMAKEGKGVLISLHDLNLAATFCTKIIILDRGRLYASGDPAQTMTDENLEKVFNVRAYHARTDNGIICQPIEVLSHSN